MNRDGILRGFASVLGADVGVLVLSMALTPIIVRLLGSAGYGDYAFVLSVLGILMVVVNAGIFDGVRKYIAEDPEAADWRGAVFGFYGRFGTLLALLGAAGIVVVTASGLVAARLGPRFDVYFYLLAVLVVVRQAWALLRGTLMGLGYEHLSEPVKFMRWVVFAAVGVPLAYVGYGVVGVLTGRIAARGLAALGGAAFLYGRVPFRAVAERTPTDFPRRDLLTFNSLSLVLILLMNSLYQVDVLLLRLFAGASPTGYYKGALVVAEFIWFVPNALQTVLLHSTSQLWAEGHTGDITAIASRVTRYTVLFAALLAAGLYALADVFVPLYFGGDFERAIAPLVLLLPGTIGFAVTRPILAIGQGGGRLRPLILATGAAAALNLGLNLVLIPRYGMRGAAVATSVGYGSMLLFHVASARRIGFDPLADLRPLRVAATVAIAAPVIVWLAGRFAGLVSLVVVPPAGFVVYAAVALAVGAMDREDLHALRDRTPLGRFVGS